MEITKLDSPDDDGLFDELARLLVDVEGLLGRVRSGETVSSTAVEAVKRRAVWLTLAKDPGMFRRFAAMTPSNLN